MSWAPQIESTNKKITKSIGILCKLRHYVPENSLKTFYNASIQSHVDYGLILWGNAARVHLNKIELSLKKAVRIMSFKNRFEHSLPLFKNLGILPFEKNVTFLLAKFMWKYVNNLHPPSVLNIFKTKNNNKTLNHHNHKLMLPFCRTSLGQRFITYKGVKTWNNDVPIDIKDLSLSQFLNKLKLVI